MTVRTLMGPGGATEAKQDAVLDALDALATAIAAVTAAINADDALTDAQLRANPVPVAGVFADENGVPFSANNPMPVDFGGTVNIENLAVQYESVISTANSTTEPLDANEVFVGAWEDVRDYSAIIMSILTDASSATNGATVQYSADGVDVIGSQFTTIPAGIPGFFAVPPQARYVRIHYTNGPVAQTVLEAQVKFAFTPPAQPQGPIGGQTTDFSIAGAVKSSLTSRVMSGPMAGVWLPVGNDGTGRLLTSGDGLTDTQLRATPLAVDGVQTDALTDAELRASDVGIEDSTDREYTHVVSTVTNAGDTTLHTPAGGKRIRLRWVYAINDPTSTTAPLIKVRLGGTEVYRVWALSKRQAVTGPVDGALVVNLSQAANVAVTALVEEI